jgi:membrane associated rhomboid family serine protease
VSRQISFSVAPMTPAVKWLIIINVAIWFGLQVVLESMIKQPISKYLSLVPAQFLFDYQIWQAVTYMFLHSLQVTHILFNMLMLWFFGSEVEQAWGSKKFIIYYLFSGIGAALIYCFGMALYTYFTGDIRQLVIPVIGASGALFGVMVAYGVLFGDRTVYFFMLFPMKARVFVLLMGLIEFANMMTSQASGSEVAYLAHLGGIASGFAFILFERWRSQSPRKGSGGKKGRHLQLVVDNDKSGKGPKYWN